MRLLRTGHLFTSFFAFAHDGSPSVLHNYAQLWPLTDHAVCAGQTNTTLVQTDELLSTYFPKQHAYGDELWNRVWHMVVYSLFAYGCLIIVRFLSSQLEYYWYYWAKKSETPELETNVATELEDISDDSGIADEAYDVSVKEILKEADEGIADVFNDAVGNSVGYLCSLPLVYLVFGTSVYLSGSAATASPLLPTSGGPTALVVISIALWVGVQSYCTVAILRYFERNIEVAAVMLNVTLNLNSTISCAEMATVALL